MVPISLVSGEYIVLVCGKDQKRGPRKDLAALFFLFTQFCIFKKILKLPNGSPHCFNSCFFFIFTCIFSYAYVLFLIVFTFLTCLNLSDFFFCVTIGGPIKKEDRAVLYSAHSQSGLSYLKRQEIQALQFIWHIHTLEKIRKRK